MSNSNVAQVVSQAVSDAAMLSAHANLIEQKAKLDIDAPFGRLPEWAAGEEFHRGGIVLILEKYRGLVDELLDRAEVVGMPLNMKRAGDVATLAKEVAHRLST